MTVIRYDASSPVDQESLARLLADLGTRLLNGRIAAVFGRVAVSEPPIEHLRLWDQASPVRIERSASGEIRVMVEFVLPDFDREISIPIPEAQRPHSL